MLAFLYIAASFLFGAGIISGLTPYIKNRLKSFTEENKIVGASFLFFPAAYLIGTLVLSWSAYFSAVAFRSSGNPLLYANILSFLITVLFLILIYILNPVKWKRKLYELKKYGLRVRFSDIEWTVILTSAAFWSFFIFRSLYMQNNILYAGYSAFSDFGAHLPVVRSFSLGQNFPAQYPHFPDGTMRYHFMFYFMAGNLEYLGFSLPWALNLPSVLSLVSFVMLLYGLSVSLTKKPVAGLLTCLLFTFRSSFAFSTYSSAFSNIREFFHAVGNNLDANRNAREHIGNTLYENWGLWAQKVYVNQRHLAFAFGLMILVLFLVLPLLLDTVSHMQKSIKNIREPVPKKAGKLENSALIRYLTQVFFTKDAWMPESFIPCILAGILLGLLAFWNGAVVIATISVLFIMAALSKHKLEYLITAGVTFVLSTIQSALFTESGTGAVTMRFKPGFLAESGNILDISSFYMELLGLLPFMLLGIIITLLARYKKPIGYAVSFILVLPLIFLMPQVGIFWGILITAICLGFYLYLVHQAKIQPQSFSIWLLPVFLAPVILATTLQLTPDITVNHKYIIMAVILLNIPVSDLLTALFKTRKKTALIFFVSIIFLLVSTGLIDMITLYNLDKNSVSYNQREPVQIWAQNETNPEDIFLTHNLTHYGAPMSILLAGRSVYSGYAYFTITAGYDVYPRNKNLADIYGAKDSEFLRERAVSEGIRYIVVEEQNRTTRDYELNEDILYETFPVVFHDNERNIVIFSVE